MCDRLLYCACDFSYETNELSVTNCVHSPPGNVFELALNRCITEYDLHKIFMGSLPDLSKVLCIRHAILLELQLLVVGAHDADYCPGLAALAALC